MTENTNKSTQNTQSALINRALGVFLSLFGVVVLISMFFTETTSGRVTNLCSGALLASIGGVMTWLAQKRL